MPVPVLTCVCFMSDDLFDQRNIVCYNWQTLVVKKSSRLGIIDPTCLYPEAGAMEILKHRCRCHAACLGTITWSDVNSACLSNPRIQWKQASIPPSTRSPHLIKLPYVTSWTLNFWFRGEMPYAGTAGGDHGPHPQAHHNHRCPHGRPLAGRDPSLYGPYPSDWRHPSHAPTPIFGSSIWLGCPRVARGKLRRWDHALIDAHSHGIVCETVAWLARVLPPAPVYAGKAN
jgi:hypothetical protein